MAQPKEIIYRSFKNFEINKFKNDRRTKIKSVNNRHPEVFCIESVLKKFAKFTGKHLFY